MSAVYYCRYFAAVCLYSLLLYRDDCTLLLVRAKHRQAT